jgi:hypothetical protein
LVWSLVKLLKNIKEQFDEHIFNTYIKFLSKKTPLIQIANDILISLLNKDLNYIYLIQNEQVFKEKQYSNDIIVETDYISLVNFYGNETYFTRGAFLDIVVNEQMCASTPILLSDNDLICSIFENIGFYFIHSYKTKYLKRVVISLHKLTILPLLLDNIYYKKFLDIINQLRNNEGYITDDDYCSFDNTNFNLLDCQKFELFNHLLHIIYIILDSIDTSDFNMPFYKSYINKDTDTDTGFNQNRYSLSFKPKM